MADGLGAQPVPYGLCASACLAEWLVDQLQGKRGWSFHLSPVGKDWSHFTTLPKRDDWSALVNYLLEQTAALPFKNLGTPRRGSEEQLHFGGSTPNGNVMFSIIDHDLSALQRSSRQTAIHRQWADENPAGRVTPDSIQWTGPDGVGGAGGGDPAPEYYAPENGPISVVVYEIERRSD
jgi:hypothetical protein